MATTRIHAKHSELAKQLRKEQGEYLAFLRKRAGLTQAEVSKGLAYDWASVVGSHEQGDSNLPPEHYVTFANLVGVDPKEFVRNILRFHNPWAWQVLFGGEAPPQRKETPADVPRKPR